jgi:hypothetical protein
VHHLQGKAEGVTPTELQRLLKDFYVERLVLLMQHEAAARHVTDYDINNAYQYIINREETHISWLQRALMEEGQEIPPTPPAPTVKPTRKGDDAVRELAEADARANRDFVAKWRDRVEQVVNARHRGMLRVIPGSHGRHRQAARHSRAPRQGPVHPLGGVDFPSLLDGREP